MARRLLTREDSLKTSTDEDVSVTSRRPVPTAMGDDVGTLEMHSPSSPRFCVGIKFLSSVGMSHTYR